jgi:hypothetical protein
MAGATTAGAWVGTGMGGGATSAPADITVSITMLYME